VKKGSTGYQLKTGEHASGKRKDSPATRGTTKDSGGGKNSTWEPGPGKRKKIGKKKQHTRRSTGERGWRAGVLEAVTSNAKVRRMGTQSTKRCKKKRKGALWKYNLVKRNIRRGGFPQ